MAIIRARTDSRQCARGQTVAGSDYPSATPVLPDDPSRKCDYQGMNNGATMTERLDELLAMAREVGRLANEVARWEHQAEYTARSWKGKNGRALLRVARKEHERAETSLA